MKFHHPHQQMLVIHGSDLTPQQFRWYWHQHDGELLSGDEQTPLPSGAPKTALLLLPASQILFCETLARHVNAANLNWQFESLSLSDPENLHGVILARDKPAQSLHLAALDKTWLQHCIDSAAALGLHIERALPDMLLAEPGEAVWFNQRWLIRHQQWQGCSASEEELPHLTFLHPTFSGCQFQRQPEISALFQRLSHCRVNMLSGEFAARLPLRTAKIVFATGVASLIFSLVLLPLWNAMGDIQRANRLQQQASQLWLRHYPQESVANPAQAFRQKLDTAEAVKPPDGFLQLFNESAAALAPLQDNPLRLLRWDENHRQLHLHFGREIQNELPSASGLNIAVNDREIIISRKP